MSNRGVQHWGGNQPVICVALVKHAMYGMVVVCLFVDAVAFFFRVIFFINSWSTFSTGKLAVCP
jgi:hypothetical protein